MTRYALLTRDADDPWLWDFGSAVRHHQLYSNWLPDENCRPGMLGMRGAVAPDGRPHGVGRPRDQGPARGRRARRHARRRRHRRAAVPVRDAEAGPQGRRLPAAHARRPGDQVVGRDHAAQPGRRDGRRGLPGHRRGAASPASGRTRSSRWRASGCYEMGSDQVEAINAISGERCNPHPHNFTDRLIRPGDQAFFDIIHSFNGYRTCYYRTFNVGSATQRSTTPTPRPASGWTPRSTMVRPGVGTDEVAAVWPEGDRVRLRQRARGLRAAVRPRPRPRPARAADHLAAATA